MHFRMLYLDPTVRRQWVRRLKHTPFNPIETPSTARRTLGVRERGSLTWRTPAGAGPATRPYGARGPPYNLSRCVTKGGGLVTLMR